jgi:putative component of membrane protein insertase Oxa1/YidC/SpoIIIJ protein YidD
MSDATPKLYSAPRTSVAQCLARALLAAYRLTLSPLIGYNCRHLPSCSEYADQAIAHLLRCHPLGTSGLDFVASTLPPNSRWYLPWRYGRWRGVNNPSR